ncbi:MAG: hypothetical protein ACOY9Y_08390, partial [Bacillota bacterium]
ALREHIHVFSFACFSPLGAHRGCSIAQKKTQPIKPCSARLYGFLGGIGYIPVGGGRKQAVVIKWILR